MLKRVERLTGIIASIMLFTLMLMTVIDVVGRNVFNRPLIGGLELTELFLVVLAFLLFPQIALREKHIVADVLDSVRAEPARTILAKTQYLLGGLCGAVIFVLIGWRMWVLGDRAAGYRDATSSLKIPLAPVYWGVAVLAVVGAVAFIAVMMRAFEPVPPLPAAADSGAEPLHASEEKVL